MPHAASSDWRRFPQGLETIHLAEKNCAVKRRRVDDGYIVFYTVVCG